jgi:flagellin-like hook-associated protein FlgL
MSDGLSAAVRTNLLALQKLAGDISRVQTRLATGKRVNTAAEGPAAFFTASALNARAAALNSVVDDIGIGKKTLEAASNGIDSMQALIKNARSLAYEALNSASTLAKVTGSVTGLSGATAITMDDSDTVTVSDGAGHTATYTHTGGNDVQDFLDAVNNTADLQVEASLTSDGRIQLQATGVNNVTVGGSASGGELSAIGLTAGTTTSTTNTLRQSLAQEFDSIRSQIDAIAADSGFSGQNLLGGGVLTITLNETGSSKVTVAGATVTASSLGIATAGGSGGNFQFDGDIQGFIADLDAASASLKSTASSYGAKLATVAVREDFSKSMSSLLSTGAGNLVNADMDYEGAMLLALQARRELAATSLSLAADADKTALRLFGIG